MARPMQRLMSILVMPPLLPLLPLSPLMTTDAPRSR